MSGSRGGRGRIVAMGVGLAVALLLLVASGAARAAKYSVAQCGWHLGADAYWADTTGGAKFRPDGYCATPAGADPFDGAHLKSFTRDGRRPSPGPASRAGAGRRRREPAITRVRGTWWHTLHDGLEQRLGAANWGGGFDVFAAAATTDVTPREFVAGFAPGMPALEDRLLCAKAETQVLQPRPRLLVGGAGADDHARRQHRAPCRDRRAADRRRLAPRRRHRPASAAKTSAPASASRSR